MNANSIEGLKTRTAKEKMSVTLVDVIEAAVGPVPVSRSLTKHGSVEPNR